jgi:hypothetical protein
LVSVDFSVTYSFRPYHGPGVNSTPSENEYQVHFLGLKAAGAWGWQPHHHNEPNVMKFGSLNFLEPSGPHRACNGNPLPLPFIEPIVRSERKGNCLPPQQRGFPQTIFPLVIFSHISSLISQGHIETRASSNCWANHIISCRPNLMPTEDLLLCSKQFVNCLFSAAKLM